MSWPQATFNKISIRFYLLSTCCGFEKNPDFLRFFKTSTLFSRLFPGLENCFAISRLFQRFKTLYEPRVKSIVQFEVARAIGWHEVEQKTGSKFLPENCPTMQFETTRPSIRHFEVARETGSGVCQTALWDCFGGRIFNMAANSSLKTVPQCTLTTSTTRLQRNLKVANWPQSSLDEGK